MYITYAACSLEPGERSATLSGGRRLSYTSCLLATGAEPARLPVPGADHPRVPVVRTLDHVRERCQRSEAAWNALAHKAERSERLREEEARRKAEAGLSAS